MERRPRVIPPIPKWKLPIADEIIRRDAEDIGSRRVCRSAKKKDPDRLSATDDDRISPYERDEHSMILPQHLPVKKHQSLLEMITSEDEPALLDDVDARHQRRSSLISEPSEPDIKLKAEEEQRQKQKQLREGKKETGEQLQQGEDEEQEQQEEEFDLEVRQLIQEEHDLQKRHGRLAADVMTYKHESEAPLEFEYNVTVRPESPSRILMKKQRSKSLQEPPRPTSSTMTHVRPTTTHPVVRRMLLSRSRFLPPTETPSLERPHSSSSSLSSCSIASLEMRERDRATWLATSYQRKRKKEKARKRLAPVEPAASKFVDIEDSAEFDTDCEPDISSDFRKMESRISQARLDADIRHLTYSGLCHKLGVTPRGRVQRQLWQRKLDLRHGSMLTPEIKAVALALIHNTRVEEMDISYNSMNAEAVGYILELMLQNIYINKLSMAGCKFDISSAQACRNMMRHNIWLSYLNLSSCNIGDNEMVHLFPGIMRNKGLKHLDLSKNEISLLGGLKLGRALGDNNVLEVVNLSWNHIRGGGAVAICKSFQRNMTIKDLDISWNGVGFEGCLALSESLKINRTLKRVNLENNRINWDCTPHLAKGLAGNPTLEVLQLGQNPISMDGIEELLNALAKSTPKVKYLSIVGIPISTKIAMKASEIAKAKDFTLEHGGILSTRDVFGIQRARREDPFSLLIRFLAIMGIRVMDLFRMFDKDNSLYVSKQKFIQGLKRARVPLDEEDMTILVKRMGSNKHGEISYQELANQVKKRIREDRMEDRRLELLQKKKREERRRILQSDQSMNAQAGSMAGLYSMYASREKGKEEVIVRSPIFGTFSRRSSQTATPLPRIRSAKNFSLVEAASHENKSPSLMARYSTNSQNYMQASLQEEQDEECGHRTGPVSFVAQMKWQYGAKEILKRKKLM